jgi:LmbE family N-acetylglucosaminyl deacetylase/SAM-dependent methyltransferase
VVTFDHREPGTSEDAWVRAGILDVPRLDVGEVAHLVVLAAHPDDESFGAAGLVHELAGRGAAVTVVVATDGEASHAGSATISPERLRAVRRAEVADAVAVLAPAARVVLPGLPDGGLREHRDDLARVLGDVLDDVLAGPSGEGVPPSSVVLCAPWRGDGHRDHRIAGEVAAEVADRLGLRLLEYPVWLWHWADPGDDAVPWPTLRALPLGAEAREAKRRALAAHVTQVEPLSAAPGDEATLGPEMLRHAGRGVEVLVDASGRRVAKEPADPGASLGAGFFERFYAGRRDPWGFETRWYEQRKRAVLLASLPQPRFRAALELGCSTGVLTAELAARCDRVVGVDVAEAPLAQARRRLGPEVELLRLDTPDEWPDGTFDLVVLSEVLYYYGRDDLDRALDRATASLADDGVLVACHWRHDVVEHPLGGDEVHARLAARPELDRLAHHVEEDFVLDVLVRRPAVSVARSTGLL